MNKKEYEVIYFHKEGATEEEIQEIIDFAEQQQIKVDEAIDPYKFQITDS